MEIKDSLTTTKPSILSPYKDVIAVFLASRVLFGVIMIASGQSFNQLISLFDGEHYQRIATYGYDNVALTAFFPIIPLLIRIISNIGVLIVNNLCFLGSLLILKKLNVNSMLLAVLALSPMGFFSMLIYTESLFFLLTTSAFYLYHEHHLPLVMGILLGLSVMTRSSGAMLFFAIFIGMCIDWYKKRTPMKSIFIAYIPASIIALIYPVYLQVKHGSWRLFIDVQYDYWIRIPSNLFKSAFISAKMLFTNAYPFIDKGDKILSRMNEGLSLFLLVGLLVLVIRSIISMIRKHDINCQELVMDIYIVLSIIAINSTIRDPYLDAPTVSFYRYYYEIFAAFLLLRNYKPVTQRMVMYVTVLISVLTSFLFCLGVFFY